MRIISAGSCTAFIAAASISLMAQAPASQQQSTSSSTDKKITVTGCLKQAPTTATDTAGTTASPGTAGTTGTTSASAAASDSTNARFVLAGATTSPASADAGATTTAGATSGAATSKDASQTYRLIANPTALSPHVGKKLELTGTLDEAAASSTASGDQGSGPVLRVESGKVVAASCQN